jgi:signal transduction histidine kinase
MPAGVVIFFAVSLVVAVGAFALIRRWLIAIPVSLLGAPLAFVLVCLAFNALGREPRLIDFLTFAAMAVPATVVVALGRLVVQLFIRKRSGAV